jgi:hypothetical protein
MKILILLSILTMVCPQRFGPVKTPISKISLGLSDSFVILTKSGVTTVPPSIITGNMGSSPIAATGMTGFSLVMEPSNKYSRSSQVKGNVYGANYAVPTPATLTLAVLDMEAAYTDASSRPNADMSRHNVLLNTLSPGVYTFTINIDVTSDLLFSGGPNDVFLIQTTGNVRVAAGVKMVLQGGCKVSNIFWQVAGLVHALAGSELVGVFLIKTQAIFITGSKLHGRVLAQTACVLQMATISAPWQHSRMSGNSTIEDVMIRTSVSQKIGHSLFTLSLLVFMLINYN